jgi:hypothetical protein
MPVARNKTRLNVWILPSQKVALDKLVSKTGEALAVHVRAALTDYLKKMTAK